MKTFDIITTEKYLLAVDKEAEIPQYSQFYASDRGTIHDNRWETYTDGNYLKKDFPFYWLIIAHLPLNGSLVLEGVSLLPEQEQNKVEQLCPFFLKKDVIQENNVMK